MVKYFVQAPTATASEQPDVGILMALAYSAFVIEMRASLARAGHDDLHRSFGYVARNLAAASLTVTELAKRLAITTPGALKIVEEMEKSGHLERVPDPEDARARKLRLTRRGRAALAAARAFHRRFERDLAARHGAAKAAALRELLSDVVTRHEAEVAPLALRPM